jgi:ATF/CREB family transcription factor
MNNNAGANSNATITPNTLNAITGVLNSSQYSSVTHAPATSSHLSTSITANQENNDTPYLSASNAASTAANGLYLLSQAHQELTKREAAQARANGTANAPANGKRGTKRKSYDPASPPPQPAPTTRSAAPHQQPAPTKRARANTINSVSTNGRITADEDEEEEDDDDDESHLAQGTGGRKKKPETEEEKRRNFLERNRQGLHLQLSSLLQVIELPRV